MAFKIIEANGKAQIVSPYNPEFVDKIKKMGGRWDSAAKVWTVDPRNVEMVRQAMREVYGQDDRPADLVSVKVTMLSSKSEGRGPVVMLGRTIASAWGRDSGARIGEGVVFVEGGADSGGSVKNWETVVTKGSVIIIHDVPRALAEANPEGLTLEILAEETPNLAALQEERERLLARVAEIDAILAG
ncbi:MAG: hypothetical protein EWM48_02045 [Sphaerochaeta sp.]|nr:MAG: hypothetical protein EWM48_02045 [Sphaerochaeta sp.]